MSLVTPEFVGRRQRKIVVSGVKYKAKPNDGCKGCVFEVAASCAQPVSSNGLSLCASSSREDGVSIIWIKKD